MYIDTNIIYVSICFSISVKIWLYEYIYMYVHTYTCTIYMYIRYRIYRHRLQSYFFDSVNGLSPNEHSNPNLDLV